ncbi:MAG: DNA mismatch repair protein MutT [Candidatus Binatia bacterium]|nr:MAG: DNA mismatch repair protein MutT [Candidatus Binatia bacterium]
MDPAPHFRCLQCQQVHYRNPAVGVAVLLVEGDRVLLARRARGRYAGQWCVPCGYVEWGEEVRNAARREMKEETGLEVTILSVCDVRSNFHDPERQTVGVWFWGERQSGDLRPGDDVDAVAFFAFDRLPPLAFPTDQAILLDVHRGILRAPGKIPPPSPDL